MIIGKAYNDDSNTHSLEKFQEIKNVRYMEESCSVIKITKVHGLFLQTCCTWKIRHKVLKWKKYHLRFLVPALGLGVPLKYFFAGLLVTRKIIIFTFLLELKSQTCSPLNGLVRFSDMWDSVVGFPKSSSTQQKHCLHLSFMVSFELCDEVQFQWSWFSHFSAFAGLTNLFTVLPSTVQNSLYCLGPLLFVFLR